MKYNKDLFINNVKYLTSYNYEPEITIRLKDDISVFVIAYKDFVDITIGNDETIKLGKIEDVFNLIGFDSIVEIEGYIDFEFPVESQSIVVDGELWIDAVSPKQVINKYKKQHTVFRLIMIVYLMILLKYFIITISKCETFDISAIIACLVFVGSIGIIFGFFTLFDVKRNKLLKKYYGTVSEEDKSIAIELLDKIKVVDNNEYDFFDLFHYDTDDLMIEQSLKLLIKGKKVYIGTYNPIKTIEQELLTNNADNKYNDMEFNNYIFELVKLLERNLCDI
jgi:hypothetical protein